MANKLKIPTLLHESNAFPGKAVKMLSKKTDCILVGFEDAKNRLEKAKKVVVTGNPTKIKDLNLNKEEKEEIITKLGLEPKKPILLVFGGSQGAKAINDSIIKIIKSGNNKNYQIIWAPGPIQYNNIKEELKQSNINIENIENTKVYSYIYNMEEIMNVSDLLICRADLNKYVEEIIYNEEQLKQMGIKAKQVSNSDALKKIYSEVKEILHRD